MPIPGIAGIAGFNSTATGGGGPAGHRYWRINVTTNHGAATTHFFEIEMRETPGGSDATGSGSAISGGTWTGGTAANAFDNNTGTTYNPTGSSGYIGYDFGLGNAKNIVEVGLKVNTAATPAFTAAPKDFTIEWSDDNSSWTVSETCALYGPLIDHFHSFPETAPAAGFHRFWRVLCTTANAGTFYLLDEIEFRATSGAADQVPTQTNSNGAATGRAIMGAGSNAHSAFDDTGATAWSSSGTTNQWCGFIFPTAVKCEEVLLKVTSNTSRTPATGAVEYSDDQVTWTSQKALTMGTWTASQSKVFAAI